MKWSKVVGRFLYVWLQTQTPKMVAKDNRTTNRAICIRTRRVRTPIGMSINISVFICEWVNRSRKSHCWALFVSPDFVLYQKGRFCNFCPVRACLILAGDDLNCDHKCRVDCWKEYRNFRKRKNNMSNPGFVVFFLINKNLYVFFAKWVYFTVVFRV